MGESPHRFESCTLRNNPVYKQNPKHYTCDVSYPRKPNVNCLVCRSPTYRRPSVLHLNSGKAFCSTKCHGIYQQKEKPCLICGTLIISSLNKKTCSRACSNKNRAGIKYKLNFPRKSKVANERGLKLRLIAQRGTKCERCNYLKIEILQVHHKDRDRNNNDLENLELICPNCHFEEHYFHKSWMRELKTKDIIKQYANSTTKA